MYSIILERRMPQRPKMPIEDQATFLVNAALESKGSPEGWILVSKKKQQAQDINQWRFRLVLDFDKAGDNNNEWPRLVKLLCNAGSNIKFNKYPWLFIKGTNVTKEQIDALPDPAKEKDIPGVRDIILPETVLTIDDLRKGFPHHLLGENSDYEIENHPAFSGIYGRNPQIRTILSAIWAFIESGGLRSSNTLLWGPPACAKTTILLGLEQVFGIGSVLRLDSTSTTRAGLEKLFFSKLKKVPPIIFMEEAEKAEEGALKIWLGAMDDRHEVRKVNFFNQEVRTVYFIAFATANDKEHFDLMMGGRPGHAGALSSRFAHQLSCPRPNEEILRRILHRDIQRFGGDIQWIDPVIDLAKKLQTNDPRKVLALLDGRERLLTGKYQEDILAIHNLS